MPSGSLVTTQARVLGLLLSAALMLPACGGDAEPTSEPTARVTDASVSGTVTGVDPTLPEGSQVAIRVFDASVKDTTSAAVIGQQEIATAAGQATIPFDVGYLEADINAKHAYVARADITVNGTLRYITTQKVSVITQDAPTSEIVIPVELVS